jgi:hypothetical protein
MDSLRTTGNRFKRRVPGRTGRPPRELAGEVEPRILDAARRVFLERGLSGPRIDEIAYLGCSESATIYAVSRQGSALTAVVMRKVAPTLPASRTSCRPEQPSRNAWQA